MTTLQKLGDAIIKVLCETESMDATSIFSVLEAKGVKTHLIDVRTWLRDNRERVDCNEQGEWMLRATTQSSTSRISQLERELQLADEKIRDQRAKMATMERELAGYRSDQDKDDQPSRAELAGKIAALSRKIDAVKRAIEDETLAATSVPIAPRTRTDTWDPDRVPWIVALLRQTGKEMTLKEIMEKTGKKYESVQFAVKNQSDRLNRRRDGKGGKLFVSLRTAS